MPDKPMSKEDEQAARAAFDKTDIDQVHWPAFRRGWAAKVDQLRAQSTDWWCNEW